MFKFLRFWIGILLAIAVLVLSDAPANAQTAASSLLKGRVSITFDDGYDGIFTYAFPIFNKYNLPATVYPVIAAVQSGEAWSMDWSQLALLRDAGWEIGNNTMTHPVLTVSDALNYARGPNLIANSELENIDSGGWAENWTRSDPAGTFLLDADPPKIFSEGKQAVMSRGTASNSLLPKRIVLPSSTAKYLFSMFCDLKMEGDEGVGVWVDEYNAAGAWVSGQWIGGQYESAISMPGYIYKPTSTNVKSIDIDIYTEPNSENMRFRGDTFFFGRLN